jgi:hypothetical protein
MGMGLSNNNLSDLDHQDKECPKVKVNLVWVRMVSLYRLSLLVNNKSSMLWLRRLPRIDKPRDRDKTHREDRYDRFRNKVKVDPCNKVNNEYRYNRCSRSKLRCSLRKWYKLEHNKRKINEPHRLEVHLNHNLVTSPLRHIRECRI